MGCICSTSANKYVDENVLDAFKAFVEENCVKGSDKCVHIQKLEAAFAFYILENNISITPKGWSIMRVVHRSVEPIVKAHGLKISPGFTEIFVEMETIQLDTRYVVGLDVVRFQK
jgi:hypothetical protein